MKNFITIAKDILLKSLPHDGVFVDYTMTDGYNTLYMAKFVSEGNIVSFASKDADIDSAYKLFESNFQDNAHIVTDSPCNVEKYVTNMINGFMLDATNVKMSDQEIIDVIGISMRIMKKDRRGMVVVDKSQKSAEKYIESMPRDRANVLEMSMANADSPHIYLIEKLA